MTTTPDTLIVGAGPTGLALACVLARHGASVRIIDRNPAPHRHSRGKGLNRRSLEILGDLGVADEVIAAGTFGIPLVKYRDGLPVARTEPGADSGLLLPQWRVEGALRRLLGRLGVTVEHGTELRDFTQDEDGVTATLAGGERMRASYLVACDGGRSGIRKALGIGFAGTTPETTAMVVGDVELQAADGDGEGLDRGVWHQWFDEDGGVMLCPFPGTASWQFQASPEKDADGRELPPSLEHFQRLFDRHARLPGVRLRNATWLSTYRVNVRMAERFRSGRVFLAGDAAHVHSIAGGLGMNTGIQDAWNLGWKLGLVATGAARPALLDTYEEERLPVAAWTLRVTDERLAAVLEAVRHPGGGTDAGADAATGGLGIGYRWSPLADDRLGGPLRAGDRAPDAPLADGTRLFEVLATAGPRYTLLGFGRSALPSLRATAQAHESLVMCHFLGDDDESARSAYGVTGDALVLVRPDNHVALTAPAPDTARAVNPLGYYGVSMCDTLL